MDGDTIFALSTRGVPAGIAVIRISGPKTRFGLEILIDSIPEPRRASLRSIRSAGGDLIDRGLVLFFLAPHSFTGEDMAELHLHGGRAVVAAALEALSGLEGFRPAEAGEFTRRAFDAGRMDLTQVEGLADLVNAETEAQRGQALRQADGALRDLYEGWRERLVRARAWLEAELDFPDEDDVPGSVAERAWADVRLLAAEIDRHLADGHRGERLRQGFEIVVLGPPNAGKSSLINALARRDVAIVSPEPGTTRDLIEVHLDLGGYPVTVVDTAGLREAAGTVEQEGVRRAGSRADAADLVLWLQDVTAERPPPLVVPAAPRVLSVGTKIDLLAAADSLGGKASVFDLAVSTVSGQGLDRLVEALADAARESLAAGEAPLITRARQRAALKACQAALGDAVEADGKALELRADDLRRATDALGRVTGRVDVEELLGVIFAEFCIGK